MRRHILDRSFVALLALGAVAGCRSEERPQASAQPSASARPSASATPLPSPRPSASSARPSARGCRVIGVSGEAARDAGTPAIGAFFGQGEWLELGANVELALRHTETTREFSVRGPGRFQLCAAGAESVSVARGAVTTTAGAGTRAGAEVLLATPFAIVRYADAKLSLEVGEEKATLRVEQGSASLENALDAGKPESVKTVTGPKGTAALAGKLSAEKLVQTCVAAKAQVHSGPPRPLGTASAGANLGDWAVAQHKLRRTARFACAQAHAAVGRLTGADLSRLSGQLEGSATEALPAGDAGK